MIESLPALILSRWSDAPTKTLDVLVDAETAQNSDRRASVERHAEALARLAANGAFPTGELLPRLAPLTLVDRELAMEVVASIEVKDVDYRAWQLLRQLLAHDDAPGPGVRQLEIRERSDGGRTWRLKGIDEGVETFGYPPRVPDPLAFALTDEDAADMVKNRRCVVSLASSYTDEGLAELLSRMTQWVELLEHGAYAAPEGLNRKSVVERSSLHAYSVDSVEMVLSLYEASEAGWSSLLNLLHQFSLTIARITDVSIE